MITVPAGIRVLVATKPVDFSGADSLAALVREQLRHDPFSGTIFVFRSKRADRLKILVCGALRWPPISDGVMRLSRPRSSPHWSTDWTGRGFMQRTFPGQRRRREAVTN
jgi:transposase